MLESYTKTQTRPLRKFMRLPVLEEVGFLPILQKIEMSLPSLKFSRSWWLGIAESPASRSASPGFACSLLSDKQILKGHYLELYLMHPLLLVYVHTYDSVDEVHQSIMQYPGWHNQSRPNSKLDIMTPGEAYAVMRPTVEQAA